MAWMTDLQKALLALRQEVDGVFGSKEQGPAWRLERVRLRMGVEWVADGTVSGWKPSARSSAHVVELEWLRGDAAAVGEGMVRPEDPAPEVSRVPLGEQLDDVFGKPGFDSAARATVFREAAAEVGAAGIEEVLGAVVAGSRLTDGVRERARHAVTRLLERGPLGVGGGCEALGRALATHGLVAVLAEVESRWQYGTGHDLGGEE
jgi:hypothetical protein